MRWSETWKKKWLFLGLYTFVVNLPAIVFFLWLEWDGLQCEWQGIAGCSTLSSWMVANWGIVFMVTATFVIGQVILGIALWHWSLVHVLAESN